MTTKTKTNWTPSKRRSIAPTGEKTLRPVIPNAGIAADYREKLQRLVKDMHESILFWITASYRAHTPEIAQDIDLPANTLQDQMDRLSLQWQRKFDQGAERLGEWFAQKTKNYADGSLMTILKDAGFAVSFQWSDTVRDVFQSLVHEQVNLIKSIASQHLQAVQGLVMRSVQQGRDLAFLTKELSARFGVTKRRAAFIARDQNNKATATITRTRQLELGITQARWRHSHAGKHPRPEHVKADGEVYEVAKGMYLEGKWTWPGWEINCRCTSSSIIPGFK
jgi:SPP1 gp7 family putative phage head morphogenesis protein